MGKNYEKPSITVDMVIFTFDENTLKVLLIKRNIEPSKGGWSLPGGFVQINESLEDSAKRILHEKTGVKDIYLEQLYTFGDPDRDSRGRVITVSYFALINPQKLEFSSPVVSEAQWFVVKRIPTLAFDHKKILDYAIQRLRWKFEYTPVAFSLLPKKFALSELQNIYEIVLDKKFDKRNFTKKLLSLNILKEEGRKTDVSHRPPMLYSLKKDTGEIMEIV